MHGVLFDTDRIRKLLEDFNTVTGIRVAFVSYDQKIWIEVPQEKAAFCTELRRDPSVDLRCKACDQNAFAEAARRKSLYVYNCHSGLTEAVSPIIYEDKLLGFLMMGQTICSEPDAALWEHHRRLCSSCGADFGVLEKAFYNLKHVDIEGIHATARIMDMSAKFIHLSRFFKLREPALLERIKSYTDANLDRDIKVSDLARELNLSSSYLRHLIKSNMNVSFTQYLLDKRIEKAIELLENSDLKIRDISLKTGFNDQNYFARVFRKRTGITATEYRNKRKF